MIEIKSVIYKTENINLYRIIFGSLKYIKYFELLMSVYWRNMMKNEEIKQVNYLEIHTYVSFKIYGNIKFDKLCEKIEVSKIILNDRFEKSMHDIFCTRVNKSICSINSQLKDEGMYVKANEVDKYEENDKPEIAKLLLNKIEVENLNLYLRNDLLEEITFRRKLIQSEFDYYKNVYGQLYLQLHDRFFLLPVKVYLENNEEFWVIPQLIVFSNLFAFIKYEIPIANICTEIIKENEVDKYIKEIKMIDGENIKKFKEIGELTHYFVDCLTNELNLNQIYIGKEFRNILLIDYDNMPVSLRNLNDTIKEEIFYILSAPVPNRKIISYKNEAKCFFETQSYGKENILFVLKTNGGCLTMISKKQLESFIGNHQCNEYFNEDNFIYKKLAIDLNKNCEYAIIANMLEKMNNTIYFLDRLAESKKQNMTYIEYNKNIILINTMIESCYGSVIEQAREFKNRMPLYHNDEYYERKSQALDRILNQEKNERELRFQKSISFLGLIFVVAFGLPTINESATFIKLELFESYNVIPLLNMNQISIILWIFLVIGVGFYLYFRKEG